MKKVNTVQAYEIGLKKKERLLFLGRLIEGAYRSQEKHRQALQALIKEMGYSYRTPFEQAAYDIQLKSLFLLVSYLTN